MEMALRPLPEHEATAETARRGDAQPFARTARTPLDVAQILLERAHPETEQLAQRVERELLAQQEASKLLAARARRTNAGRLAPFAPRHRLAQAANESTKTAPAVVSSARPRIDAARPPARRSKASQVSAPRAKVAASGATRPSR